MEEPPPRRRGSRVTEEELSRYLFGDPRVRGDDGVIGRLTVAVQQLGQRVDRLTRLGWAVLIVFLTALLTLVASLLQVHH